MLKLLQYLVYPKESAQTQTLNNRLLNGLLWAAVLSLPLTLVSLALDWPAGSLSHGTSLLALLTILIYMFGGGSIGKLIRSQDPNGTIKNQNTTRRWLILRSAFAGIDLAIFFFLFTLVFNPITGDTSVSRLPFNALIDLGTGLVVALLAYAVSASIASDKRRHN